jgi:hypothetical protein
MTYNQVIDIHDKFVKAHYKLKGFGNGFFYDAILHDQVSEFKYPLMFMEDIPAPSSPGVETFVFRFHFMAPVAENAEDLENPKFNYLSTNTNEVKSDMRQCAKDLLAFWVQSDEDYPTFAVQEQVTFTFFEDETEDRLAGCYVDITFRQPFTYNVCAIPADDVPSPPDVSCDPATYQNSNGTFVTEIPSGLSFTAPDVNLMVNGQDQGDFPANTDISVTIDIPTLLNTASIYVTGQDVSFLTGDDGDLQRERGVDFYNLAFNTPFDNAKRITGTTGGYYDEVAGNFKDVDGNVVTKSAAFPNDILLDWSAWDNSNDTVFMVWFAPLSGGVTLQQAITGAPYSNGGFNGFYVLNIRELFTLANWGEAQNWFCYEPIDHDADGNVINRVGTSTYITSNRFMSYISTNITNFMTATSVSTFFTGRYATLAELGL